MKNEPGNPIPPFAGRLHEYVRTMRQTGTPESILDSLEEVLRTVAYGNPPDSEPDDDLPPFTQKEMDEALAYPDGSLDRRLARLKAKTAAAT